MSYSPVTTSTATTFTTYGRVPLGQTGVGVGSYTDTVVITVTF